MTPAIAERLRVNLPRYSMVELAELMNVSRWTVRRWAKMLGHSPGRGRCKRRLAVAPEPLVAFPPRKPVHSVSAEDVRTERLMMLSRRMGNGRY